MIKLTLEGLIFSFGQTQVENAKRLLDAKRPLSYTDNTVNGVLNGLVDFSDAYTFQRVKFSILDDCIQGSCTCHNFTKNEACVHFVAALMECMRRMQNRTIHESDDNVRRLISIYQDRRLSSGSTAGASEKKARLLPFISSLESDYGFRISPAITFKIGYEKLYVLRNIRSFIEHINLGDTFSYGKQLTLNHDIENFDEPSKALIHLLRSAVSSPRFDANSSLNSLYTDTPADIRLPTTLFGSFFDLYKGQSLPYNREENTVLFSQYRELFTIDVESIKGGVVMSPQKHSYDWLFDSGQYVYGISSKRINRFEDNFKRTVFPLVRNFQPLQVANSDLPAFCSSVLPQIQSFVRIHDSGHVLDRFKPEECTPCYYFDWDSKKLSCTVKYKYGDNIYEEKRIPRKTIRDTWVEEQAKQQLIGDGFIGGDAGLELTGDDKCLNFITDRLPEYRDHGEVFISERLRGAEMHPSAPVLGVSVSDGSLLLDINLNEFPAEELEALYASLLKRKKYHRLSDGRFMKLNGGTLESVAEMSHMLQLSPKEIAEGHVQMPAFRALYVDAMSSQNGDLRLQRDASFRDLVRRFKHLEDSDYPVPDAMTHVLRPYQETGYSWLRTLHDSGFGGILADEMGLGKTLQVITYLASQDKNSESHTSLVVCPTSLVLNWKDEFAKFAPHMSIQVIDGSIAARKAAIAGITKDIDVCVTSYDMLKRDIERYSGIAFSTCVLDEGQFIKNQNTQVSKAVKRIDCRQRFVLTGTPIENRLSELWNLFDFIMPGYLFTHNRFLEKLEKPIIKSEDAEAQARLNKLVQPFMLRRLKKDVLKELPPKIEHTHRITLSEEERKVYLATAQSIRSQLSGSTEKLAILAGLTRLRQICCDPALCFENYEGDASKLNACMELVQSMVENGHQILLFSQFTSMLAIIRKALDELGISYFLLQGDTSREKRAEMVSDFNAGKASVFLISLKAGGTGLNLTAADVVIHYDPWWNIAAQNQATDRAHRIGQMQSVHVYRLIAEDTIEEKILQLQERKANLLDSVTDGAEGVMNLNADELLALLD